MNQFNIKNCKKSNLIELLSTNIDKRRKYYVFLTTCYFSPDSAKAVITDLSKILKIAEIYIYIDRKTAIAIGKEKLKKFINSYNNDFNVELYAVDSHNLFHSKAYAAISYDGDQINCGSLVIGSANLTGNGITSRNGNIESLLETQETDHLINFTRQLDLLNTLSIDDIDDFNDADKLNFKYALLQEGFFIHKWSDNLAQYLSVRYYLNDSGKERISDSAFSRAGFSIETATISKRYFNFDYNPPHLDKAKTLTKQYGIETYLGYWIPYKAAESLIDQTEFDKFRKNLEQQLTKQLSHIKENIQEDLDFLCSEKVIDKPESNIPESFEDKTKKLLGNDFKLKRIFSKYEAFQLPYDISQKDEIEELFNEMLDLIESRKKKNTSMKAFLRAIDTVSLDEFNKAIEESIT